MKQAVLDTNLLVRYFTRDDPSKVERVETLLNLARSGKLALHLPGIVLAELVWVLESSYRLSRDRVADLAEAVLHTPEIHVEQAPFLARVLHQYRETNIDWVDAWIAVYARERGIRTVYTFDERHFRRTGLEVESP